MQLHLENMTCGGCARTVTKVIQNIDPEASIITDPPTRKIEVKTSLSTEQVANALREAGFPPREVNQNGYLPAVVTIFYHVSLRLEVFLLLLCTMVGCLDVLSCSFDLICLLLNSLIFFSMLNVLCSIFMCDLLNHRFFF